MSRFYPCLRSALFLFFLMECSVPWLQAQEFDWGGSIRGYQFFRVEPTTGSSLRRDSELWILRLTGEGLFGQHVSVEAHPLLQLVSPSLSGPSRLATATTPTYLPLDHSFTSSRRVDLVGSFDRLNLQIDLQSARIVAGRQAITWGVTYFWPSLDLFASFAPRRGDRDYKPGVDAVRASIPLGAFSEVEVIGAVLGSFVSRDGAAGALARIYLGPVDVGVMGGRFHQDTVAGGFFTANVQGTGLRGEVNWTQSGDAEDLVRDRRIFWRTAVGIDRQLTPTLSLTLEFSFNGYGGSQASDYLDLSTSDRVVRGEVTALGKFYTGISSAWRFHPLGVLTSSLLINWQDPSTLWVPSLSWSTGNNSEVSLGSQIGLGKGLQAGIPQSEYGSLSNTLFAGFRVYF